MKLQKNKAVLTAVILLVVVALNVVATAAADRLGLTYDMTRSKLYNFSDLTLETLRDLDQDITITYIGDYDVAQENYYSEIVTRFLSEYQKKSGHIKVEYKDPNTNSAVVDYYQQEGIQVQSGSVIIESESRKKHYYLYDMFNVNANTGAVYGVIAEMQLTSGILYVTGDVKLTATYVNGHGEAPSNTLINLFDQMGFTYTAPVTLTYDEIPEETNFLIIAGPTRDFDPTETEKITKFIENGGKVMLFLSQTTTDQTNFKKFLQSWGTFVYPVTVFDQTKHLSSNPLNIYADYTDHSINTYFNNQQQYVVMPESMAMEKIPIGKEGLYYEELLMSGEKSYAKINYDGGSADKAEGDANGPLTLATLLTYYNPENGATGNMFVSGSANMYGDDIAASSNFANGAYLQAVIKHCEADSVVVDIPSKSLFTSTLNLPYSHAQAWGVVCTAGIPLVVLLVGLGVFLKRRKY